MCNLCQCTRRHLPTCNYPDFGRNLNPCLPPVCRVPPLRIAAAPPGLSWDRGADQVTRTTRVANAPTTTFASGSYGFILGPAVLWRRVKQMQPCGFPNPVKLGSKMRQTSKVTREPLRLQILLQANLKKSQLQPMHYGAIPFKKLH